MLPAGRSIRRALGLAAAALSALLLVMDVTPALLPAGQPLGAVMRAAAGRTCHQMPARSFALAGRPLAACARCTGLHASGLAGGLLLLLPLPGILARTSARALVLAGVAPLAADALLGMAWPAWDHPVLRCATGVLAGTCCLLTLAARWPSEVPLREGLA